ncbi:MAG TPA: carbonate dehydratase, partial [Bdellovibrionales bacterium]|nr:carbonate dehydratase [Bdellovibrionales bacterium]
MLNEWHALSINEMVETLAVNPRSGLNQSEVKQRLDHYGPNSLTYRRGRPAWFRFLLQFHQPLVYILLGAAALTAAMSEWVDSGVIFTVVLINAVIGFTQESKALSALAALSRTMRTQATVLREHKQIEISADELVPGDIVLLNSGDKVPADLRLIDSRNLKVDESALTGESVPVSKDAALVLEAGMTLADRKNMAYASTLVTYGQSSGVVVATANQTEIGRISTLLETTEQLETPLTQKIKRFSHFLLLAILALSVITFAIGAIQGESLLQMLMVAVALAVSAIPEGLPAAITITLAVGVSRMAKRNAIIRKLPAVETLGSTTVICSDKTGTLTQNQMTVLEIFAGGESIKLEGGGYSPEGRLTRNGKSFELKENRALIECLTVGMLCNDSAILRDGKEWKVQGDPTEGALMVSALKAGLQEAVLKKEFHRLDVVPFESEHQYMATLHEGGDQKHLVFIKGAIEVVVARSISVLKASGEEMPIDREALHSQAEIMAHEGLRILALAKCYRPKNENSLDHEGLPNEFIFLGLQGMIDPPRSEAISAIEECRMAGIEVKMITGDHASTAQSIAQRIGLRRGAEYPEVLEGRQLAEISDDALPDLVEQTAVFARVTPEQKLRLVTSLQSRGHVVSMTGDGVNDGPALKRADIGVAMGITGTEVAKEAAEMVLTDDNFASIVAAIEEGRGVFANLTKFIVWTLPTNGGEALVILSSIILATALPILPVQILWINMTTAVLLGMMLAFEPKEPEIMNRPPRDPSQPILSFMLIRRIVLVSILLLVATFGLFQWELSRGLSESYARTVAVNVLVMGELFYLFNCRSLTLSIFHVGVFSNRWLWLGIFLMVLAQLFFTYLPVMNSLFGSAPISPASWGWVVASGFTLSLIIEMEKLI